MTHSILKVNFKFVFEAKFEHYKIARESSIRSRFFHSLHRDYVISIVKSNVRIRNCFTIQMAPLCNTFSCCSDFHSVLPTYTSSTQITEIAAKNARQAAQDPVVQMQLKELQLKAQEVEIKMKKMQIDAAAKADQLELEKARISAQKEIAGMQVTAKAQAEKANIASKEKIEGFRLGSDIGRSKAQMAMQEKQKQQPSNKEIK